MNYNIRNVFKTTNQIDTYPTTSKYYNSNIVSGRIIINQVYINLYIFIVVLYNVYITGNSIECYIREKWKAKQEFTRRFLPLTSSQNILHDTDNKVIASEV